MQNILRYGEINKRDMEESMIKKSYFFVTIFVIICFLFTGCRQETEGMNNTTEIGDENANSIEHENADFEVEYEPNDESEYGIPLIGQANTEGNSIGNLNEHGLLAKQGDWIYFNDSEVDLFRKQTTDESEREILGECNPYYINVLGEWIYYCEWSDKSLCKMKIDGSEKQILLDEYVDYVYVEDDWIYYKGNEDNNSILCRMRTDGSENEKIFDDAYCVYQGRIYYKKEVPNSEYQLCSISIGGSDEKVLVNGRIRYLNIDDDWIYYRGDDEDYCLYKMKIDGTEKTCLTTVSASNIIVWDEWIYFIAYDEDDELETDMIYRINKDGTNIQQANNVSVKCRGG